MKLKSGKVEKWKSKLLSNARRTLSGVNGTCRRRLPVASKIALPIAAPWQSMMLRPAHGRQFTSIDQHDVDLGTSWNLMIGYVFQFRFSRRPSRS
jgi:hypothetical protein